MAAIDERLQRMIEQVIIVPLYGKLNEFTNIDDAINFLNKKQERHVQDEFQKYEILVSFSNGDKAEAQFKDKEKVREFLQFIAKQ